MNRIAEIVEKNRFPTKFGGGRFAKPFVQTLVKPRPFDDIQGCTDGTVDNSKSTQSVCPCCGAELKNQRPHVDLNSNTFLFRGQSVPLSPTQAEIMAALVRRAPKIVSHDALIAAVWGLGSEPDNARHAIKVHLHKIRQRLQGVPVAVVAVLGTGYRLVLA